MMDMPHGTCGRLPRSLSRLFVGVAVHFMSEFTFCPVVLWMQKRLPLAAK